MTSARAPRRKAAKAAFRTVDAFASDAPPSALVALARDGDSFHNIMAILNPANHLLGGQALAHCLTASCSLITGAEPASAHILFVARPDSLRPYSVHANVLRRGHRIAQLSPSIDQGGQPIAQASVLMRMAMPEPPPGITPYAGRTEDFGSPDEGIPREDLSRRFVGKPSPLECRLARAYPSFEIRLPRQQQGSVLSNVRQISAYWLRLPAAKGLSAAEHFGLFALASDFWFTLPMVSQVPERTLALKDLSGTSLDHAIWFHSRPNCAEWLLFQTELKVLHGSSALVQAFVTDEQRQPIATVLQEVYLRTSRSGQIA